MNKVNEEKVQLEANIEQLKQNIKDEVDAKKVHEKKGLTMVIRTLLALLTRKISDKLHDVDDRLNV